MATPDPLSALTQQVRALERSLQTHTGTLRTLIERSERTTYSQLEALINLYRELDGHFALPPLRNWAISPDAARQILALVRARRPQHVVECGAGASTILLGHLALTGQVGRVTSFEHDPLWHEVSRQRIRDAGLDEHVDLVFAPLIEHDLARGTGLWYDIDSVQLSDIDMVIVDGPPADTGPEARRLAPDLLLPHCLPGCGFVVDDYIRPAEQAMVRDWIEQFPMQLVHRSESVEKWLAVVDYLPEATDLSPDATGLSEVPA